MNNPSKEELKEILLNTNAIAVVGLSDSPNRTSFQVAKAMQDAGYKILPVNPKVEEVLGEKAYKSLEDINEPFEIINVFRKSEYLPNIAKEAVKTDAKIFWAQQGVYNETAYNYLDDQDFTVIMDSCIKVVHSILIGK